MTLRRQFLQTKGLPQLASFLILFGIFSFACGIPSGPAVVGCVVTTKVPSRLGFDCVDEKDNHVFFKPLNEGYDMKCAKPHDVEDALKACKQNQVLKITLCSLVAPEAEFLCQTPQLSYFNIALSDADNYFCMNERDYQRIIERCNGGNPG